jgi:hypothetical protein
MLHLVLGVGTVWLTWGTVRRFLCRLGQASGARARAPEPGTLTRDGRPALAEASWFDPTTMVRFRLPTIAGLIVACDPILLNQQTLVMTETLATFLAILSLWCLARFDAARTPFNAAMAGGAIGLAVLCRPTFLPWLGLVAVGMALVRGRNSEFRIQNAEFRWLADFGWRAANVAGFVVVAAAVVSPWVIRNYRVFGKPIVTTTHGGYTLVLGNNLDFYSWLHSADANLPWSSGSLDVSIPVDSFSRDWDDPESELESDQRHYKWAWFFIKQKPIRFLQACIYRIGQLWSPLPHRLTADESVGRRWMRYATCAWYCGVYVLAAVGVWKIGHADGTPRRAFPTALMRTAATLFQTPWVWGVLLCVAFTAVHTLYWTNLRMSAPLMPFVAMVAAAGASSMFRVQGSKLANEGP